MLLDLLQITRFFGVNSLSPFPHSQSPSVSCQDISVDTPTTSPTPPGSFRRCLQADLSAVNPDSPSPTSSTSSSSSSPSLKHPMYNKQVADSCIVRVSVEFGNNGNVYKSILVSLLCFFVFFLLLSVAFYLVVNLSISKVLKLFHLLIFR